MAVTIIIMPKSSGSASKFFQIMDPYIQGQGFTKFDDNPKIYFSDQNIPPNRIKGIIEAIKSSIDYKNAVKKIYYSTGLKTG